MLSRTESRGSLQVLFHAHGSYRLIVRTLKSTKAGNDSVSTQLFRFSSDQVEGVLIDAFQENILVEDLALSALLTDLAEQIETTSQKEIESYISDLLPPREVVTNSCILLQESENIFEMTPTLRIGIFKELFNLLDMDAAKDRLTEEKKTIQMRRQLLQEDTAPEQKFARLLSSLRTALHGVESDGKDYENLAEGFGTWREQPLFRDLLLLDTSTIQLTGFTLQGYTPEHTRLLQSQLQQQQEALLTQQGRVLQVRQELETVQRDEQMLEKQITTVRANLDEYVKQLTAEQSTETTGLQDRQKQLLSEVDMLEKQAPIEAAAKYDVKIASLTEAWTLCQQYIAEVKQIDTEKTLLTKRLEELNKQLENAKKRLEQLETQHEQMRTQQEKDLFYHCDKIDGPCPYVGVITKIATTKLTEQMDYLQQQKALLSTKEIPAHQQALEEVTVRVDELIKKRSWYEEFFLAIQRTDLQTRMTQLQKLQQELAAVQRILSESNKDVQRRDELLLEQARAQTTLAQHLATQKQLRERGKELKQLLETQQSTDSEDKKQRLQQLGELVGTIVTTLGQLQELIESNQERTSEILLLQEKETNLKELQSIFQRELLLVALQELLPVLQEVINSYLSQVVDFTLVFELPQSLEEDIELQIWIDDAKGRRTVKSLSGGQKAILRLCWILAVSSYFKQSFLLLDETINSLDNEAIGRVADMLTDFVAKHQLSFFVVTHAPQIQEMQMRKSVVQIS